ncbi:MAG: DNA-directed RNA polymerase subunit D [Desulfurococcales archaeon ex4484_58]|nr:MAG: DNA-directed RNA polymerase subunit D [Desulfurococcales archaeon ex4484_58]
MVEIRVLEKNPYVLKLHVKDIPLHVLNSIRRTILSEVPTMAVDFVVFTINSSVFYDEYIAHRLGLIPLTSEEALEKYKSPEECREAGEKGVFSEDCFVKLELEGKGREGEIVTLYSGDLKTSDPDVKPIHDKIPILALTGNQEIKLEAYARLGRGKEHAKWSPVSIATHKYVPNILIDYEKCKGETCKECIEVCPRNIFDLVDGKLIVKSEKIYECTLCRYCEEKCPVNAIRVKWIENEFILTIESTGSLSTKKILLEAVKILEEKINDFINSLKERGVLE